MRLSLSRFQHSYRLIGLLVIFIVSLYYFKIGARLQMLISKGLRSRHLPPIIHFNESNVEKPNPKLKYVTANVFYCGELGNQIWRFASLYAIGLKIGREAFISSQHQCYGRMINEIAAVFPNFAAKVNILDIRKNRPTKIKYADDCCKFEDPEKFRSIASKIIEFSGSYLQSFRYFGGVEFKIAELFEFEAEFSERIDGIANRVFSDDVNPKICVHTRGGDFKSHRLLESTLDFTAPALKLIGEIVLTGTGRISSLVLFGTDAEFLRNLQLQIPKLLFAKIYKPANLSRTEDMGLAVLHCDSFLLSAAGSTFAWWIGYLMQNRNPQRRVYFNGKASKSGRYSKDLYDFDIFPPTWTRLLLRENGSVEVELRTTIERHPEWNETAPVIGEFQNG